MKSIHITMSLIPNPTTTQHNPEQTTQEQTQQPTTTSPQTPIITTTPPHNFKIGQNVWSTTFPTHQQQIGFGSIQKLFDTSDGPAFQFYDEINGGFRLSLIKDIIHKPNGRMINSHAKAQSDLNNPPKKDKKK
jgi:hypothetical protein